MYGTYFACPYFTVGFIKQTLLHELILYGYQTEWEYYANSPL